MKVQHWLLAIAGVFGIVLVLSYMQGCFSEPYHSEKKDVENIVTRVADAEKRLINKNDSLEKVNTILLRESVKKDSTIAVLKLEKEYGQVAVKQARQEIAVINAKLGKARLESNTAGQLSGLLELQAAVESADKQVQYVEGVNNRMQSEYESQITNLKSQIVNKDSVISNHVAFRSDMRIAFDSVVSKYNVADEYAGKAARRGNALKIGIPAGIILGFAAGLLISK